MTTSFSETHTTEELLPAESEEEKDDEEEVTRAFQNRPYPPHIGKDPHTNHTKTHIVNWNAKRWATSHRLLFLMPLFSPIFSKEPQSNKKGELIFSIIIFYSFSLNNECFVFFYFYSQLNMLFLSPFLMSADDGYDYTTSERGPTYEVRWSFWPISLVKFQIDPIQVQSKVCLDAENCVCALFFLFIFSFQIIPFISTHPLSC